VRARNAFVKLAHVTVRNFRSITDAYKLPLRDFAVLVGPNNEGKSNILKAIVIALSLLTRSRYYRSQRTLRYRYGESEGFAFDWGRDYPVALQGTQPDGRSDFVLEFELSPSELEEFRQQTKINLATHLKLKLSLGREDARFDVLLQGKAKKKLAQRLEMIARFVGDRLDIQYVPAIRTASLAEEVIDELLSRELAQLESDPAYVDLLAQLEASQRPTLDALAAELTRTVASFIPEVERVELSSGASLRRALRRSTTVLIDDGTQTDLAMKGDGIKSLTAIALLRHTSQKALGNRALILAIEEPESHLHPSAVHRLREVLQEIASSSQVILTTHSPVLIDRHDTKRNIVVQHGRASPARHVREIRDALGVAISDNLTSASLVLLVEGDEDAVLLSTWMPKLSAKLATALANGNLGLDTLNGASNLRYKASLHKTNICSVHAFVDNDDAGRSAVEAAVAGGVLGQTEYHSAVCQGMTNSELEDLLVQDAYRTIISTQFGVALNPKFMGGNKKPWSDRLRANFADQGKPWSKSLERQVKAAVSAAAAAVGLDSLNEARRGPIDALVTALENRLAGQ
jgi:putative ATP-dependent endonuclease of the OLD family